MVGCEETWVWRERSGWESLQPTMLGWEASVAWVDGENLTLFDTAG